MSSAMRVRSQYPPATKGANREREKEGGRKRGHTHVAKRTVRCAYATYTVRGDSFASGFRHGNGHAVIGSLTDPTKQRPERYRSPDIEELIVT